MIPVIVIMVGLVCIPSVSMPIGVGIVAGAVIALVNGILLSLRVDFAADSGDPARALLAMQLTLLLTLTVVGVATVILIKISLSLALAAIAAFAVTHLFLLAAFYWTNGRGHSAEGMSAR